MFLETMIDVGILSLYDMGILKVFSNFTHSLTFSFLSFIDFTSFNLLAIVLFAGAHVYVGSFSQLVYLVQVFPDKVECFKVLNCVSATTVPFSKYIFMWTAR